MKLLLVILLTLSMIGCAKQNEDKMDVTSIDQVAGEWQWVSTCGGIINSCSYASETNYAVIDLGSNGKFVELHNGTVYKEADYVIVKVNETSGTLRFNNIKYESSVRIVNNHLEISRGELVDTYQKIN
jgi:hypothetical protein